MLFRSPLTPPRALIPLGRRGSVGEVASTVLFLLSELGGYITGQCVVVDGGLSLRSSHYGPYHNIPEFLESEPAREKLRSTFERLTGGPTARPGLAGDPNPRCLINQALARVVPCQSDSE